MAVQILSDLHLEAPKAYDIFEIVPKAPYLALLGDIGNIAPHKNDCIAFLTRQLKQFRAVLFILGNHEAYHSMWSETLDILHAFEQDVRNNASLGEFVLLDRAIFELPGTNVIILGCSLFSFIPPESEMAVSFGLNDFFQINDWDVEAHNEAHRQDVAWLNAQVAELQQRNVKIMILSHWSPSKHARSIDPKHAASPITSAFSTDLSDQVCFKNDKVKVWAFGHTHYNCDFMVKREGDAGPLRLLANQRGYYFAQAEGFNGEKTVEV
ncbi:Metallo-dependent phosphatase-like protein [Lineolata rhizophorae]|uniref:Metallo-dependent phosphatase-like protein n=1 Tax=Lineolata rhizophorae TaxID=578093 RepID=A0A6A6P688_9PEZI|nr:Metallo-dependent phosphatase-like protein [Lineolata rhizophorae]